jgi:hypothetical protein
MVPALLIALVPTVRAADLTIALRSPEGDFGSLSMGLEVGMLPPGMLPVRLSAPVEGRRKKAIYTAETRLETMGSTLGLTVQVFSGEAEERALVLDAAMLIAPGGVASYRGSDWTVDVTYKDTIADEAPPASPPAEAR